MQFNYLLSCSQQWCDVPNIITLFTIGWTIASEVKRATTMVKFAESKTRVYCSFDCFLPINVTIIMWMFAFFCVWSCVYLCECTIMCVSEARRQYGISLVQGKCGNENNVNQISPFTLCSGIKLGSLGFRWFLVFCFFLNGVRKLIFSKADKVGRELNS